MEHQGAISIGSINDPFWSEKIDYNELTRLMWHEAAHEWWGNNITEKDIAEIWIHEAFATYTEAMAMEFFDGKVAAQKLLRSQVPGNKEPVIGSYGVNDFPPAVDELVPQSTVQRGLDGSELWMLYQFLRPLINAHANANGSFLVPPSDIANNGLNVGGSALSPSQRSVHRSIRAFMTSLLTTRPARMSSSASCKAARSASSSSISLRSASSGSLRIIAIACSLMLMAA
jgi:hypothetical protein